MENKYLFSYNFSFLKNGLLENQSQWPVLVREGVLTIDPTLYASNFGPRTPKQDSLPEHVANTPGVRLEYLRTNATKDALNVNAEGLCTIEIRKSGTFNAHAVITWPDSSTTRVNFVAPSRETFGANWAAAGPNGNFFAGECPGPYPVFMTLQELADTLDTFVKDGNVYFSSRSVVQPTGYQWSVNGDPGYGDENWDSQMSNWGGATPESDWQLAATVFMPMCKNLNQMSAWMNSNESWNDALGDMLTTPMDRWDPHPLGPDAANVYYGMRGASGDMRRAHRYAGHGYYSKTASEIQHYSHAQFTQQANHGGSPHPKWRTRCALAAFLKDGVYTISSGGAIIPYTYDPERVIGGYMGGQKAVDRYAYGTWDGGADIAAASSTGDGTGNVASAQFYGGFVQGPFCLPTQAHNICSYKSWYYEWRGWPVYGTPRWPQELPENDRNISGNLFTGPGRYCNIPNPIGYTSTVNDTLQRKNISAQDPRYLFQFDIQSPTLHNTQAIAVSGTTITGRSWHVDNMTTTWVSACGSNWLNNYSLGAWYSGWKTDKNRDSLLWTWHTNTVSGSLLQWPTDTYWFYPISTDASPVTLETTETQITFKHGAGSWHPDALQPENPDGSWIQNYGGYFPDFMMWGHHGRTDSFEPNLYGSYWGNRIGRHPERFHGIAVDDGTKYEYWFDVGEGQTSKYTVGGASLRVAPGRMGLFGLSRSATELSVDPILGFYLHGSIQWQSQSLEMWLLSDYESETGYKAWDYIKPTSFPVGLPLATGQWPMGRNRNWPGHTRCWGDKLGHHPNLVPGASNNGVAGYGIPTSKYSLTENGCSAMFIDLELKAYFPDEHDIQNRIIFEMGEVDAGRGKPSGVTGKATASETSLFPSGSPQTQQPQGLDGRAWTHAGSASSTTQASGSMIAPTPQKQHGLTQRPFNIGVWHQGTSKLFSEDDWTVINQEARESPSPHPPGAGGGWGDLSNSTMGTAFSQTEGTHVWRCAFDYAGMHFFLDGGLQGNYPGGGKPCYGFRVQSSALNFNDIAQTGHQDHMEVNVTDNQLQIDSLNVRHVPSEIMLPFTIETTVINEPAAKYNRLEVEANNINRTTEYNVRASICTPGTTTGSWEGYGRSPGTPVAGFENLELYFSGGIGSVDLSGLPNAIFNSGFTVRFEFYIPHVGSQHAPVNWDSLPEILNWKIKYDLKPTVTLSAIGNTYNNDISSPITTKIGHIMTFESTGTTTDPDRVITHVKYDFGDGTVTDWIAVTTPAMNVTHRITHAYSSAATGMSITAVYKDDNANETATSTALTLDTLGSAPIAVLRASPMMVRAGQTVRLDATKSYDVDNTTLQNFRFTPGDGSSVVGPQAQGYTDHTYAVAGEYRATVTCEDGSANVSNPGSCIIKVLPANLVIPLTLNTMPSSFQRQRQAKYSSTAVLDAAFPEMRDTGQRSDQFVLDGIFLKDTADVDIAFMEELLMSGALVEFEYQAVNYQGTPDSKTFIGRMTDFQYEREGGRHGQTPYSATFVREAALGV